MGINAAPDNEGSPTFGPTPSRPLPGKAKPPAGPPPKSTRESVTLASRAEIEKWFAKTYLYIGIAMAMIRPMTSQAIISNAEKCAKANAELCMEDKRLRELISKAMVVGKYSAVFAAHLPILLVAFAESRPEEKRDTILGYANILADPEMMLDILSEDNDDSDAA